MESKEKPSVRTQYQVTDGKIVALQADPECREMSRMVADLNRRVIRVQTHGLTSWEKETEKGRLRGFGVEVAHDVAEDESKVSGPSGSGSAPFYTTGDEPPQQDGTALVQQYLEDVEEVEGKPGPVKRTVRRWVYGRPAAGPRDSSCCCRQVEAVAGKMTIQQASGMHDQAVDQLLVDVYFSPPPKRGVGASVRRRASDASRRLSERLRSVARRISHLAGMSGSTREGVGRTAGAEADTVQLRQSRHPTRGPPAPRERESSEEDQFYSARSSLASDTVQLRQSRHPTRGPPAREAGQHEAGLEIQAADGSQAAPRERESSEEDQFHNARSSLASDTVQLRQSRQPTSGPPAREVGQHEAGLEEIQAADGSEAAPRERESSEEDQFHSARSSLASNDERAGASEDRGRLQPGHNVGIYQVLLEEPGEEAAEQSRSSHQLTSQRRANGRSGLLQVDESSPRDRNQLSQCDHHKSITEDDGEITRLRMDMVKVDVNAEQDTSKSERPDQCICVNEKSKSHVPDSQNGKDAGTRETHFKGERRQQRLEASEQKPNLQLPETDRRQIQGGERRVVGNLDVYILNDSSEFDWEPIPEHSEEEVLASQPIGGLEFEADSLQNNEDEQSLQHSQNRDHDGPSHSNEGEEVTIQPEQLEENTQNVENDSKSTNTVKGGRKTI